MIACTPNFLMIINTLLIVLLVRVAEGSVIVETKSGRVEGIEVPSILQDEKYFSFMGIPYAEPPLGELRFMPPKPHHSWSEVLNGKQEKKPCAQFKLPTRRIKEVGFYGEEDCLHLSIHIPKLPNEQNRFPAIVFMQNENFKLSHNASKDYGPDFFMKEGVIIVTVNHRLGSLGFLSFGDDLLPGNNALRDVILAATWLKDNIESFGGDPKRITLMGSLNGGGMADMLLHSRKAKGLFSGVILQSGTSWSSMYFIEKTKERAIEFSKVLDEEATSSSYLLKRLSTVDAVKLTENEHLSVHADEARALQKGILAFGPVIEHDHPDAVFTELPENKPLDIDIPVMIGYNSREGLELMERYLERPQFLTFADRDFLMLFPRRVDYHFKIQDNVYFHAVDEIKQFYFEEGYIKISKPSEYTTYLSDVVTFYHVDYTVRKYANESKAPVYYYTFDYSGDFNVRKKSIMKNTVGTEGTWGASTADELCYLFVCKSIRKTYKKALEDEYSEEIKILKNMVKLWANFAKTGNPTPKKEDFQWTPATAGNKEILVISDELQMRSRLHEDRVAFWDQLLSKYQERAVNGVVKDVKDEL